MNWCDKSDGQISLAPALISSLWKVFGRIMMDVGGGLVEGRGGEGVAL